MTSIKDRQKKTWPHLLSAHGSSLSAEIAPTESGCSHELHMQPSLWICTSGAVTRGHWTEQKSPRLLRRPTWSHPDRSNERQSSAITHITLQSEENENIFFLNSCLGDFTLLSRPERWLCSVKTLFFSLLIVSPPSVVCGSCTWLCTHLKSRHSPDTKASCSQGKTLHNFHGFPGN